LTWVSYATGLSGVVSAANSLVGSDPNDHVGYYAVIPLSNGNYLIPNPSWNGQRGAVTWGSGTTGVTGTISEVNSLVGSDPGDAVGSDGQGHPRINLLANGNYVVQSPAWNGQRGAATWGSGTTGVAGTISDANSLVGTNSGDRVGDAVTALTNGNYVIESVFWNANRGAVTWGNGNTGVTGTISSANSLVGTDPGDGVGFDIARLSNGNYVVESRGWNGNRGAATWANGTTGITGTISSANSLVGRDPGDGAGLAAAPFGNDNYVVESPAWNGNRGALTWANGTTGSIGIISSANSLVGSNPNDRVGAVRPLSNGNYVVLTPSWNNYRGAVTWVDGSAPAIGTVSESNSLVGSNTGDIVGADPIIQLTNGNYLVQSSYWNSRRGAVTWGNGLTGVRGVISESNSLVGTNPNDRVGTITLLSNGNYVVSSSYGTRGAVTWGSGRAGVAGTVSAANSLVGSGPGDFVGGPGVTDIGNGNYVVISPNWNSQRGAVTWCDGITGLRGAVSAANSLVGSSPNDRVGYYGVIPLNNRNVLVWSPFWNSNRGSVTWLSGTTGQTLDGRGTITTQNSVVGVAPNAGLGTVLLDPSHQWFLAPFGTDGGGRVTVGVTDPNLVTFTLSESQALAVTPDFLTLTLNTGTAVVLQANNDITINDPIIVSAGGNAGALTLQAGRSIIINASITTDNGNLTLIANDQRANGVVDSQRDPGPAAITMAGGTTLHIGTGTLTVELRNGAGLSERASGAISLQTVIAAAVSVVNNGPSAGSDVVLGSVTTAGPQSYADPNGTTLVTGNLTATDNAITFADSVAANGGVTVDAGAAAVNFASGTLAVGPGVLSVADGVVLSASVTFRATLNGTDPGSYSQLVAAGPINLGGSTLSLVLGFTSPVGASFTLLTTADPSPVAGTFAGLAEGAVFTQDNLLFQITYVGGADGNSVVLTRLAPAVADHFVVSGYPSQVAAGTVASFTVLVLDQYGNTFTDYRGTIHMSSSDPLALLHQDYTFTTADAGQHTFLAFLDTAGIQWLDAVDTVMASLHGRQDGILVVAG
jgi:hypothetical protein